MLKFVCLFLIVFFSFNNRITAQIVRSEGSSQVQIATNQSKEEAMEIAKELAIIDALNNAFGTYVEQNSEINIHGGIVNYNIIGTTKVKGDWLKTLDCIFSEDIETTIEGGQHRNIIWITCNVKGKVRKALPKPLLHVFTLKCPELNCTATRFKEKDKLYIYFKSPISGFLSIFIDEGDSTRRVFPYVSQPYENAIKICADKAYFLFAKNRTYFEWPVDELQLFTNKREEVNSVYIVFSENDYYKPVLTDSKVEKDGFIIPKSLKSSEFENWISESKIAQESFQAVKIRITINKY